MAGVYIHIPFCKQQCSYCDFHFSTTYSDYRERMISMICKELVLRADYLENKPVETIYFGGGTPSLLAPEELRRMLKAIYDLFTVQDEVEITLEANPDDMSEESISSWKEAGINRLSIGLQSFRESDLTWMNRAHTLEEAMQCVELAQRVGFENITVDLIYGLPNLSLDEWGAHIDQVCEWNVPHLSAYCLTVEEKTALHHQVTRGKIKPGTESEQSLQFMELVRRLAQKGYEQYEVSNFGKSGFESKHNSNYWKGEWYLGVGPSAHSFNGTSRSWNVANNRRYMDALSDGTSFQEIEELTAENQFNELLLTGLRTIYGVSLDALSAIHVLPEDFMSRVAEFTNEGWVTLESNSIFTTHEGKLRADYIASELFV